MSESKVPARSDAQSPTTNGDTKRQAPTTEDYMEPVREKDLIGLYEDLSIREQMIDVSMLHHLDVVLPTLLRAARDFGRRLASLEAWREQMATEVSDGNRTPDGPEDAA